MQKIIKQDLSGSEEQANLDAKYTWSEGEIAWYFCTTFKDVFKVKFTGEHWIVGNKWGRSKIYQYEYLEASGDYKHRTENNLISHGEEDIFYSSKKEAVQYGLDYIERMKNEVITETKEVADRLKKYRDRPEFHIERGVDSFERDLNIIRENGFKPIAVSQLYFEETFVFETSEEAKEAFEILEKQKHGAGRVVGWWYGREDFLKAVKQYENEWKDDFNENIKVKIFWL